MTQNQPNTTPTPEDRNQKKGRSGPLSLLPQGFGPRAAVALAAVLVVAGTWYSLTYIPREGDGSLFVSVEASNLSTTTSERVLDALTIPMVVPTEGRFVAADLDAMEIYLYEDGKPVAALPILTKGKVGTPFETPNGLYQILTKEENHLSTIGHVYMPYSMQFYGNYFVHGWPYYEDGTPVDTSYSGGCIRLATEDAKKVFEFADRGTKLFVYEPSHRVKREPLPLAEIPLPAVTAESYLIADIDTGEVYAEQGAQAPRSIASVTKLMTALVANETISYERKIPIASGDLMYPQVASSTNAESVIIRDLFYPLLMESNNAVARTLAEHYGTRGFVGWMNSTAASLDMNSTRFADASGESPENISTAEDLYRLAVYLSNKKSFVWKVSRTPSYTLTTVLGTTFQVKNFNHFANDPSFVGGKVGQTLAAGETMLSVFKPSTPSGERRIAVVVLKSSDHGADTKLLKEWFSRAANSAAASQAACAGCATTTPRRIIDL